MSRWLLAAGALARRGVVRFLRQPSRIAGVVASPVVFWLLLGSGLDASFSLPGAAEGVDYRQYFFPGTAVLVLFFAAIFSNISVIEDRREGFLQGVLAAPLPRSALVAGKVAGGAALAFLQGVLLLPIAPLAGLPWSLTSALAALGALALLALGLTALGFAFAWRVDSTQGFHAVMNLVLMPLWLLSGAVFPVSGAPAWLAVVMRANPLTYGVELLRAALTGSVQPTMPSPLTCLALTLAATALTGLAALAIVHRDRRIR